VEEVKDKVSYCAMVLCGVVVVIIIHDDDFFLLYRTEFSTQERTEGYIFFFITILSLVTFYFFGANVAIITHTVISTALQLFIRWRMFEHDAK